VVVEMVIGLKNAGEIGDAYVSLDGDPAAAAEPYTF